MKAIEVKSGDRVWYKKELVTVFSTQLNTVTIQLSCGAKETVSYSQIQKYEYKNNNNRVGS